MGRAAQGDKIQKHVPPGNRARCVCRPSSITEDCLYLNVFTTQLGDREKQSGTAESKGHPVLVWIHGGGNVDGESNDYDATKLATGGPHGTPTVVITINYRLSLFGFLSETHLNAEGHLWGNYGILDQQAALRWVQANIAAFGGDPTRVALGGQSAGAIETGANQLSPLAAGLFNRAIYESSPGFFSSLPSASVALANGAAFAAAAGCSGAADSGCLRKLSTARILQLAGTPNAFAPFVSVFPLVDGTIIPLQPEAAWTSGKYNHMPIMGGSTRDEGTFGDSITEYFSGPPQVPLTPVQYVANVSAAWGASASKVLAQYPLSKYGNDPELAYDRVSTDPSLCRALHVLKAQAASDGNNGVYGGMTSPMQMRPITSRRCPTRSLRRATSRLWQATPSTSSSCSWDGQRLRPRRWTQSLRRTLSLSPKRSILEILLELRRKPAPVDTRSPRRHDGTKAACIETLDLPYRSDNFLSAVCPRCALSPPRNARVASIKRWRRESLALFSCRYFV